MAVRISPTIEDTSAARIAGKRNGHTRPEAPTISLDQPGRLRVANLMHLLNVSHAHLYKGITCNRYPKPDGYDGRRPYWKTETIREFLRT